ncbi:rolling circle replication-associated protein, partial [Escherichia coli]|uniref:rolling circle replication-associated protein n=7 Tax=Enterobacteriaceae TaxID=543 RepID=UPI001BC851CE
MATLKLYHNGLTAGIPPMKNNHERAKRGEVKGWSKSASRNNTKFLRSVHVPDLTGAAVAFTLTIRDCPPSSEDWKILRENFIKRLRRAGMVRLHWLTEWQQRGVPHLHGIAYFPDAY